MGVTMEGKILDADQTEYWTRSMAKAVTYRLVILLLDFIIIYWFTGRYEIALGFMLISNVYTSVAYYLHERVWARIRWGISDLQ